MPCRIAERATRGGWCCMNTAVQLESTESTLGVRALRRPGPGNYYLYMEIPTALIYGQISAWIISCSKKLNEVYSPFTEPWVSLVQKGGALELKIVFAKNVQFSELSREVLILEQKLRDEGINVWLEFSETQ